MSLYTNTEEHKKLMALFSQCQGDPVKIFHTLAVAEAQSAKADKEDADTSYRVCLFKLKQKTPTDPSIFACHMIAGDYSKGDSDVDSDNDTAGDGGVTQIQTLTTSTRTEK